MSNKEEDTWALEATVDQANLIIGNLREENATLRARIERLENPGEEDWARVLAAEGCWCRICCSEPIGIIKAAHKALVEGGA